MTKVFLGDLPIKIASIHKETAREYTAAQGYRDGSYGVFSWRRNQRPKTYKTIDEIPATRLYMPAYIAIDRKEGDNIAIDIAVDAVGMLLRMAPVRTGAYRESVRVSLNDRIRALSTLRKIQAANPLTKSEIVEVWSAVEYASTLEAPNYNEDGIYLKVTRMLIAKWGSQAAIKFAYRSGRRLSQGFKYMTPVIVIGARGAFASSTQTRRGYQMRKRKRQLAKMNKAKKERGQHSLSDLPRRRN